MPLRANPKTNLDPPSPAQTRKSRADDLNFPINWSKVV